MHAHRKLNVWKFIRICVALGTCIPLEGMALAGSTAWQPENMDTNQSQVLLTQIRPVPPYTPPYTPPYAPPYRYAPYTPPHNAPPYIQPRTPSTTITPPPVVTPHLLQIPPTCQVTTAGGSPTGDCDKRYINSRDLSRDFYSCNDGRCYAWKFLQLKRQSMIIIYPEPHAERQQARAELRAEMVYGVKAMGTYLNNLANDGISGLPSIDGITQLVQQAIDEIDSIDQPVGESLNERRRRLGLEPALSTLANKVLGS